jgi:hypothetical protein
LNKGEARHALADAIYTNRQGELVRTLLNSAAALARNPARGGETPDCGG